MAQIQIDIILGLHQQEYSELFGEFSSWRSESATCFLRPAPHSPDALIRYLGQVALLDRFYCKQIRNLDENLGRWYALTCVTPVTARGHNTKTEKEDMKKGEKAIPGASSCDVREHLPI